MQTGDPIPLSLALAILRQLCDALEQGGMHGDVNPSNVFISEAGAIRLIAPTGRAAPYVAPEVVMTGVGDPRSDLFSLGVIAHEMLANRPLFLGADPRETIDRVMMQPIPPPSTVNPRVPPDIDGIVLMALSRDPMIRWQTAGMMRDGLAAVIERFGLQLSSSALWARLLEDRNAPPPAPMSDAPPQWADDTNNETRIRPVDSKLSAYVTPPPPAPSTPAPPPARSSGPAPLVTPPPARTSGPAPLVTPPPARTSGPAPLVTPPRAQTPTGPLVLPPTRTQPPTGPLIPQPLVTPPPALVTPPPPQPNNPLQPAPGPLLPPMPDLPSPIRIAPPRASAAPIPTAAVEAEPPPRPSQRAPSLFDLGPEPTQIGARPLITGSDEELSSLVGEPVRPSKITNAPKHSAPVITVVAAPPPEERKGGMILFVLLAVLAVVAVVVLVVM
jgi:serine/threonine protein kinase